MNDDIRILRDALKRYRDFVEVPDGDPMEVPLYWYNSAKSTYAEACSPDRIRRLLDDAERLEYLLHQLHPWSFHQAGIDGASRESIDRARKT